MEHKLTKAIQQAFDFVVEHTALWDLKGDHIWLEVSNHVLRILIQMDQTTDFRSHFTNLVELQKDDGGWGEYSDSKESSVRVTAFSAQMLLRANLIFKDELWERAIQKALLFVIIRQNDDGSWNDRKWHKYDATSVPIGTLLFGLSRGYAQSELCSTLNMKQALEKSMNFIHKEQREGGLWQVKQNGVASIESTAHLLQKCITYRSPLNVMLLGIKALLKEQRGDGSWAEGNVDASCDVVRCMLYFNSIFPSNSLFSLVEAAVDEALEWLIQISKYGTVGYRPESRPNVLVTCDLIDTACKYLIYVKQRSKMLALYS